MKDERQNSKQKIWKILKTRVSHLVIGLSAANTSISGIINLIHIIIRPIGLTSILLGNIGCSILFNSISLIWNTASLVKRLKERSLYRKCNVNQTMDAKVKDKRVVQGIWLNILSDILFLTGSIAAIALFVNPISIFVTMPLITLGCIVMISNIVSSTYYKVKNFKNHFSQLSKEEQESLHKEVEKEMSKSRFYKAVAKILPEIIVLAQAHSIIEDENRKQEVKRLKEELYHIKPKKHEDLAEESRMNTMLKEKESISQHYDYCVTSYLSLGRNAVKSLVDLFQNSKMEFKIVNSSYEIEP